MTLRESAPDADQTKSDSILYHLRRSFAPGDKNHQAQFWCARQLAIGGKFDEEARPLFKQLSEAYVAFREKKRVQGVMLDSSGTPKEFVGTVILLRDTYGFIKCDALEISVFISTTGDDTADCIEYLTLGSAVRFQVGFNLMGPVAVNPQL
jgi:hypothetical protein